MQRLMLADEMSVDVFLRLSFLWCSRVFVAREMRKEERESTTNVCILKFSFAGLLEPGIDSSWSLYQVKVINVDDSFVPLQAGHFKPKASKPPTSHQPSWRQLVESPKLLEHSYAASWSYLISTGDPACVLVSNGATMCIVPLQL